MMSRKFFRNISIFAITLLLILAMVQMLWVRRLYLSALADFTNKVEWAAYKSIHNAFYVDEIYELSEDKPVAIDLDAFALYFKSNLLEFDVFQSYYVEIVCSSEPSKVLIKQGQKENLKNLATIDIPIDEEEEYILRLFIEVPLDNFFSKISGLIFSSIAIVLLLSGFLTYVVRMMFKQKTLDEMRRDFTHNITHELKTPIAVAITATDAMRNFSTDADIERRSRYLEIVESQLTQLSAMVEQILAVSVENLEYLYHPINVNLLPMMEQVVQNAQLKDEKNSVFHLDCPRDVCAVVDVFHMKNVWATLIDNAIKYATAPVINIKVLQTGDNLVIVIQDNGCGIAKEHLPHIFEKYYRVPTGDIQKTRGYGLGLYYAYQVVKLHKGKIIVKSREGKGTIVTIKLPNNEQSNKNITCRR